MKTEHLTQSQLLRLAQWMLTLPRGHNSGVFYVPLTGSWMPVCCCGWDGFMHDSQEQARMEARMHGMGN